MNKFPVSISEAARRLKIDRTLAAILVRTHHIATEPSPVNPAAKMLDANGFARLKVIVDDYQMALAG